MARWGKVGPADNGANLRSANDGEPTREDLLAGIGPTVLWGMHGSLLLCSPTGLKTLLFSTFHVPNSEAER